MLSMRVVSFGEQQQGPLTGNRAVAALVVTSCTMAVTFCHLSCVVSMGWLLHVYAGWAHATAILECLLLIQARIRGLLRLSQVGSCWSAAHHRVNIGASAHAGTPGSMIATCWSACYGVVLNMLVCVVTG